MPPDYEKMTTKEIAILTGINASTIRSRMEQGMSKTEAATMPIQNNRNGHKASKGPNKNEPVVSEELLLSKSWLCRGIK